MTEINIPVYAAGGGTCGHAFGGLSTRAGAATLQIRPTITEDVAGISCGSMLSLFPVCPLPKSQAVTIRPLPWFEQIALQIFSTKF